MTIIKEVVKKQHLGIISLKYSEISEKFTF